MSPLARGAGHGIGVHTGGHTFEALTEAFLFTPTGALTGTQRLRQAVEVGWDPHEFNATEEVGSGLANRILKEAGLK